MRQKKTNSQSQDSCEVFNMPASIDQFVSSILVLTNVPISQMNEIEESPAKPNSPDGSVQVSSSFTEKLALQGDSTPVLGEDEYL